MNFRFSPPTLWISGACILAAGGLGYLLFSQISWSDPAAQVRKKYAASQVAPHGLHPVDSVPAPVPSHPIEVQSSGKGDIQAVLPADIAAAQTVPPPEPKPEVQVPAAVAPPVFRATGAGLSRTRLDLPPVPQRLLDQTPPTSWHSDPASPVPPQLRLAPRRYLFNNQSPDVTQGKSVQIRPEETRDFNPETFAPLGENILVALMGNVASNSFEVPVEGAVWQPFYFQGHRLLEVGDKLVGRAQAGKNRDRILVSFSRIILKSGRSLPIQATALEPDGTVGIRGLMVGDNLLRTLTPVLLEAVRGFAEVFQDRTESSSIGVFGPTTQSTLGNELPTKGLEAGRGALEKISQIIAQDLEENRPYVLVLAGSLCQARLLEPMDVSTADYGK